MAGEKKEQGRTRNWRRDVEQNQAYAGRADGNRFMKETAAVHRRCVDTEECTQLFNSREAQFILVSEIIAS